MGSNQDIQEVKTRADIVSVISRYVQLKPAGRNFQGLCPFHGEKTPSFHVNPTMGIFKCFGCGEVGDVITFVQKIEHLEFAQALTKLAEEYGVSLHTQDDPELKYVARMREMNTLAAEFFQYMLLKHPEGRGANDYTFNKRKFTEETAQKFKIGYAPKSRDLLQQFFKKRGFSHDEVLKAGFINDRGYDKYSDRLMFPIHDTSGHIVGFSGRVIQKDDERPKYLNSAESVLYKKRYLMYGLYQAKDAISKANMAIVCEGQPDTLTSQQAGVVHIVAPLGTSLTETQLALLGRYTKNIAFCYNTDAAGQKALFRSVQLTLAQDLVPYVVTLPDDVKDIDELVQKRPDEWKDRAKNPIEFFALMGVRLKEVMKHDIATFETRFQQVIQTLSSAPELKQQVVAKQLAPILNLTEQSILSALKNTVPIASLKQEARQRQGAMSTAEYLMGILVTFPLPLLLMGKIDRAASMLPTTEMQLLFSKLAEFALIHKNLVESVLDKKKKTLQVSWVTVYIRFTNEISMEFASWLGTLSQAEPQLQPILERLALEPTLARISISDDVIEDFFKAWERLQRQAITMKLEVLRKKISSAELASQAPEIELLQADIQEQLGELKKLEKNMPKSPYG
jgi:DNA primase